VTEPTNLEERVVQLARSAREASRGVASLCTRTKNDWLLRAAERLEAARAEILAENRRDLAAAEAKGVTGPMLKRLDLDGGRWDDMISGLRQIAALEDPVGEITEMKVRPNGLPEGVPVEKTLEQIGRTLTECGEIASDHGVEIWVEVHGQATKQPAIMRRIMDACGHPAVGVTWNSNDSDVASGSVSEAFGLLQPFIRCCHITDLWSDYPYQELFSLLEASGYDRFTLCEFHQSVPAVEGGAWLRRYRERWTELQDG